jgi:uncharacterized protein RhaS with RHS repeats
VVREVQNGVTVDSTFNTLSTPLALYNGQGQLTWTMALDTYGGVQQGKGRAQDCPFRYQGQYEDVETDLYYNRFRYYDTEA